MVMVMSNRCRLSGAATLILLAFMCTALSNCHQNRAPSNRALSEAPLAREMHDDTPHPVAEERAATWHPSVTEWMKALAAADDTEQRILLVERMRVELRSMRADDRAVFITRTLESGVDMRTGLWFDVADE